MSPNPKITIEFSKPSRQYLPGEEVSGQINVDIAPYQPIKLVTCAFKGRAEARYGGANKPRKEYYFNETRECRPGEADPIHQHFPFSVILPTDCPPSFDGRLGYIMYSIEATVKLSDRAFPFTRTENYLVLPQSLTLLEYFRLSQVSQTYCREKRVGGAFNKGSTKLVFSYSSRAIFPGDAIRMKANITNNSTVLLTSAMLTLWCKIEYHSYFLTKKEKRVVHNSDVFPLDQTPGAQVDYNFWMAIPELIPPQLCDGIITIRYFLSLRIKNDAFLSMPSIFTRAVKVERKPENVSEVNETMEQLLQSYVGTPSLAPSLPHIETSAPPAYENMGFDSEPPSYTEATQLLEQH